MVGSEDYGDKESRYNDDCPEEVTIVAFRKASTWESVLQYSSLGENVELSFCNWNTEEMI